MVTKKYGRSEVRDINHLDDLIDDLDGILLDAIDELGEAAYEEMMSNWEDNKDALGRNWKSLSPVTQQIKESMGYGDKPILVRTGALRDSIIQVSGKKDGRVQSRIGVKSGKPRQADILRKHEFGMEGIPKRPVLRPTARWANKNTEIFEDVVKERLIEYDIRL